MRLKIAIGMSVFALAGSCPAAAQDALDRTDPSQAEVSDESQPVGEGETRIETVQIDVDRTVFDDTRYEVGAIVVEGLVSLSPQDFSDIVQDYSARTLGAGDLSALSDRIAVRARERGFIFANAVIAPQSLSSGVLRVRLDEGVIDEIRIEGDADPAIISQLKPLCDGRPVTLARLERHVLLAGDISGVRLRSPRYERGGESGILIVEALRDRFAGRAELANDGSQPIGPLRARIDFDANGLISPFDEIDFTYSTVPTAPGELQYLAGRYSVVVTSQGMEVSLGASYSATRPGAYLSDRDIFGKSARVSARLRHPLRRSRGFSIWIDGELEFRDLRQDRFGALARHDRIPVARLGFYSRARMLEGAIRGGLTLSQGLDILDATQQGDPLASREDASPDFTVLSGWFEWERALASSLEFALAGRGQLSSTPLLITEDIGLGGNSFLRGYDFSERSGDNGIMGSAELRYDWRNPLGMLRRAELYAFADGGVVGNLEDGRGSGSLASSGGGIRTDITRNLDFDLELAFPLTGPRYDTDDKSPRFNIAVTQSF